MILGKLPDMIIHSDLKELFQLLNESLVEYVVVGGYAVAYYGFIRATKDVNVFYRNSEPNIERLMEAISQFGIARDMLSRHTFSEYGSIVRLGASPMMVEFINRISGVAFDDAWESRATGTYGGIPVPFLSREPQAVQRTFEIWTS